MKIYRITGIDMSGYHCAVNVMAGNEKQALSLAAMTMRHVKVV